MNRYNKLFFLLLLTLGTFASCDPYEEDDINIGNLPEAPTFTASVDPTNANKIVITNTSEGFVDFVWDIDGGIGLVGTPNVSTLSHDTVLFSAMGTYDITLYATKSGGSGTSFSTQTFVIDENAVLECDDKFSLLTNGCTVQCWKLSNIAGAINVGPAELSSEWFSSPEDGHDPSQADDTWCFSFEDVSWTYNNNGSTFSACQGFVEDPAYPVPTGVNFNVVDSGTTFSDYKIILPTGVWMGVEDSGSEYQIVDINENEMILLAPIATCDGTASPGWFTITFVPAN